MLFHRLILIVILPTAAFATIFVQRPLQDQVQETPTIVRGTIGMSHSDWGTDGSSKRLYTFYPLQVSETLKGDIAPGAITIRELGGEKGGIGMQVAGAAHFSPGEDVVVFLGQQNTDDSYNVQGLASGKFNLSRRQNGEECLRGVALARPEADGFVHGDEDSAQGEPDCSWTLAGLRQTIRQQGDAPQESFASRAQSSPKPSPLTSTRSSSTQALRTQVPQQAAFQLQPSTPEERGFFGRGSLWVVVLVLGLAGLGILLLKPKH